MKIQPQNPPPPPVFTPLTITLETPEEVAKFQAIFQFNPIVLALELYVDSDQLEPFKKLSNANADAKNLIIDYAKWHKKLQNM